MMMMALTRFQSRLFLTSLTTVQVPINDEEDGCMEPIVHEKTTYTPQSVEVSTVRLEIFLSAVKKIGGKVTHVNAYGAAVHRAMKLVELEEPFYASSTVIEDASIMILPHPSRCVNHADIGV